MENQDIILLTSIVSTLFIVFLVALYKEFKYMSENEYKQQNGTDPRSALLDLVEKIGNDTKTTKRNKKIIYDSLRRNIADMETDGVYFDKSVKQELKKKRDELHCEYSGLPSVKAYEND